MATRLKPRPTYDDDFYAWTQDQAKLLRAQAAIDPTSTLDWLNLAEEIEAAGRAELHKCQECVEAIVTNLLKIQFMPAEGERWRIETAIVDARIEFERRTTPTISRLIEASVARRYANVCRILRAGSPAVHLPETCPYTMVQILSPDDWLPTPERADA